MRTVFLAIAVLCACSSSKHIVGVDAPGGDDDTQCPGQATYSGALDQTRAGLMACVGTNDRYTDCPAGSGTTANPDLIIAGGDYSDEDSLEIDLYKGGLIWNTDIHPASGIDLSKQGSFADCEACVIIDVGFDGSGFTDQYLATSGNLDIDMVSGSAGPGTDGHVMGTLTDVTLAHVLIDTDNNTSTVVDDCTVTITSASFDEPVLTMARNVAKPKIRIPRHARR